MAVTAYVKFFSLFTVYIILRSLSSHSLQAVGPFLVLKYKEMYGNPERVILLQTTIVLSLSSLQLKTANFSDLICLRLPVTVYYITVLLL